MRSRRWRRPSTPHRRGHRDRRHQRDRVRVPRRGVQLVPSRQLDDLAQVHDRHLVTDVPHHGQVVRDHHVRQAQLVLQVFEQVDHLGLDRHVQGRDRLVRHDQLGPQRERAGDPDPLALAAGELVRVAVVVLRVEPDQLQQFLDGGLDAISVLTFCSRSGAPMIPPDGVPRVQRRVRVLEDHLDVAAQRAHLAHGQVGDVMSVEHDPPAGRLQQPGEQPPGRGLAAAGLADQAQRLPGGHREVHLVHGLDRADLLAEDDAPGHREVLHQRGHLEQGVAPATGGARGPGGAHWGAHTSPCVVGMAGAWISPSCSVRAFRRWSDVR